MYVFSFVLANFGIAMDARIPMITTTIRSSISVKPRDDFTTNTLQASVGAPTLRVMRDGAWVHNARPVLSPWHRPNCFPHRHLRRAEHAAPRPPPYGVLPNPSRRRLRFRALPAPAR